MQTEIIPLSELDLAVALLKEGEPVVFPTETVYGLGAPVFIPAAIEKIFSIKKRPSDNPLIVHIHSLQEAELLCEEIPSVFFRLADFFWPGTFTMVLRKKTKVPSFVSAGHPTIAIRMPDHKGALQLIQKTGQPLAAPSANLSGRPSPTNAFDVFEDLKGAVKLILDGGPCSIGIESTVLSLVHKTPTLLRPGCITKEEIEEALATKIALASEHSPIYSPGMKYRHYAPRAKVNLRFNPLEINGGFVLSRTPSYPGERFLSRETLYAELREADRLGVAEIEIACDSSVQKDTALFNRLLRAANLE